MLPATNAPSKGKLIAKFSEKFGVDQDKLTTILKETCFKVPSKGDQPQEVSNEQLAALLIVADQYGLNPFTREIYAFPDKGKGIVPIVGVDGWTRIMNEHPAFDGIEFRYSENMVKADEDAKDAPEWVEAVFYRKDRTRPIVIREYLDECYRPAFNGKYGKVTGPWQSHTRRFLRHKALIQGARVAFGFSGVYDEDEGERIAQARVVGMSADMPAAIEVGSTPADFDQSVLSLSQGDHEKLTVFLAETAKASGVTVDDVKSQAAGQMDGFVTAFNAWKAKPVKAKTTKPKPEPAQAPESAPATAQEAAPAPGELPSMGALIKALQANDVTQADIKRVLGLTSLSDANDEHRADLNARLERLRDGEDPGSVFPTN